jgi:hypothetical protein
MPVNESHADWSGGITPKVYANSGTVLLLEDDGIISKLLKDGLYSFLIFFRMPANPLLPTTSQTPRAIFNVVVSLSIVT